MKLLNLKELTLEDLFKIKEINHNYLNNPESFLVQEITAKDLVDIYNSSKEDLWVIKKADKLLAYIHLKDELFENKDIYKYLNSKKLNEEIEKNYTYISQIAVNPKFKNEGLGSIFYSILEEIISTDYALAFVVNNPKKNEISLNFHYKNDFEKNRGV